MYAQCKNRAARSSVFISAVIAVSLNFRGGVARIYLLYVLQSARFSFLDVFMYFHCLLGPLSEHEVLFRRSKGVHIFDITTEYFFPRATRLRYSMEKTERKCRENNENLVHRPFTSNNNEQIDKPQTHEDTFGSKIEQKTSCDYPEKYCKVGANDDIVDRANKRITRLRRKAGA